MSQNSSDKRTYSVDEMMDRLRDSDREKREEGELVTREDGSQVMRVKKRKRRSKQKKEEEAKRRKKLLLLRTVAVIALPLFLGLGVVYLLAKYHSPSFSKNVVATIWEKTGGSAKVRQLSPTGTQISARSVQLNWPDGSPLDQLQVENLQGDLSLLSFVSGNFRGEELRGSKGFLLTSGRENRKIEDPGGDGLKSPGFKSYANDYFSFFFGRMNSPFRLEGSRVKFVATDYSRQLSLTGGELTAGSWGAVPLKRGTLEFLKETIKVISLRFEEADRHLVLSGDLSLADSIHSLSVEVVTGTVGNVGGAGLENLVVADISEATGTLVFRPWNVASHEVTISASPEYLIVQNFSFLDALEELYGDARFQEFEFELNSDFDLIRSANGVEIRGLNLLELGVLAIKGNVKVSDGELSGTLEVGLPDHKRLTVSREQRKSFFANGRLEDGFFWFEIELGGTTEEPTDNFLNFLSGRAKESAEDLFEQLTQ